MKRFWKKAEAVAAGDGWEIALDGRPVRTPSKNLLILPTEALARAIAQEWDGCADTVDPRAMPLTGVANAAIDRVAPDRHRFAEGLARYAASDLLCYRANHPTALVSEQAAHWDPPLRWVERRLDVSFEVTTGVAPIAQSPATLAALTRATEALDSFVLAGLSPLVTVGGSIVIALAVVEGELTVDQAWTAVSVDERFQIDTWGRDPEAVKALDAREADFRAGGRFLSLLA